MIAYDNRVYYRKSQEPFSDPEWEAAEQANEAKRYFWVETKVPGTHQVAGRFIKLYKPSVAKLVSKRTGCRIYPVKQGDDE